MLTPQRLIAELRHRGYDMTSRRVTDWIQKGLLPPLTHKGQGRGQGSVYFWPHPDVIAQAVTVHELLARHSRTEAVLLRTWFAGYPIAVERARQAWLAQLEKEKGQLHHKIENADQLEDRLGDWASSVSRKLAAQHNLEQAAVSELCLSVFNLLFADDYKYYAEDEIDPLISFATILSIKFPDQNLSEMFGPLDVQKAADFLQENFSLQSRGQLDPSNNRRWRRF